MPHHDEYPHARIDEIGEVRMPPELLPLVRHALGADSRSPGFRNYYCAGVGDQDYLIWQRAVELGFAEAGHTINGGKDQYFRATRLGAVAAGLDREGVARAFPARL